MHMARILPPISSDQVRAFVELTRAGNLRLAASALHLSEEGVRSRLVALEHRLGVTLYEKQRGRRARVHLTYAGQIFAAKALQFLDNLHDLTQLFDRSSGVRELQVVASQFLAQYLLIDIVRAYHELNPDSRINMLTRNEQQISVALTEDPKLALGICAPLEYPPEFVFQPWFSMPWSFIAPADHPMAAQTHVTLEDLVREPLIMFEAGSTGRQHIMESFYSRGLTPRVAMEATSTQLIVRMVEARIGTAIVPLLRSGIVTHGIDVRAIPLGEQVRPITSGVLHRREAQQDAGMQRFAKFVLAQRQ
jgi:DNA-binding transcriptional LysR family regulator